MFLAGTSDISLCKPIITLNAIKQKNIDINLALFLHFAAISLHYEQKDENKPQKRIFDLNWIRTRN